MSLSNLSVTYLKRICNKKNNIMGIFITSIFIGVQFFQSAFGFGNYESRLIFYPMNRNIVGVRLNLENNLQDTYFYTLDGVKLNAWYIKAQSDKPTVIYCHGQGENISLWQSVMQKLIDNGYGVFMLEYRGHGRSSGSPSETGLYLDLESAIKYLKEVENVPQDNIVLWGRSLGGAVVADIASRDSFKGVILESTFTNIRDAAIHLVSTGMLEGRAGFWKGISLNFVKCMPFVQKFETDRKVSKISSPLLIAASENDITIPCHMSKDLAALNPNAQFYLSSRGSHHESEWFKDRAIKFLDALSADNNVAIK